MEGQSEEQRAKAAYHWLRVSPLLTIPTLAVLAGFNIPSNLCAQLTGLCHPNIFTSLDLIGGVLLSGLWHLTLLRFVNDPESEFVRRHGRQALTYAGIRTSIALGAVTLDYFTGMSGVFSCFAVAFLIILWGGNTKNGLQEIAQELKTDEPSPVPQAMEAASAASNNLVSMEENAMSENDPRSPEEILDEIYANLQSEDNVAVLQAIASLEKINFSSQAVRRQLEKLSLHSGNRDIRNGALAALNLPAQRHTRSRLNKLQRSERNLLLHEINGLEKDGLLENQIAEVIRRRYDFDFTPLTAAPPSTTAQDAPVPAPVRAAVSPASAIAQGEANVTAEGTQAAVPAPGSAASSKLEGTRATLIQTLLSEASIKIYLYLGAFFVIAAAAIIGVAIPELRIPILIIGTLVFGGLSLAIKKRLPQPSFALFIVFSFLLPITANTIEETLRQAFNFGTAFSAGYWVFVYFIMAAIWSGSTWLYESRLFSITAFIALALAFFRVGDIFDARPEFYATMTELAAIAGLGGVWFLKKWRDSNFALPLFLTAQILQAILLVSSISIFGVNVFNPSNPSLWHLASFFTWGFAFVFYIFSNRLFPFLLFPWLVAGTLIPMPWFITAAFDVESLGSTIILLLWGGLLAAVSEGVHRFEAARKYSLPILLASMPTLALALITSFTYDTTFSVITAFVAGLIYAVLHLLRIRWWLWTLSLLNFIIAYFAFFEIEAVQKLNIFFGYPMLLISILFLLPDLFLKKDFMAGLEWRLPARVYGLIFASFTSLILLFQNESNHAAVCFAVYALFFAAYTFAYRRAAFGYVPVAYLPLAIVYGLAFLELDWWLPSLTILAVLYFSIGLAIRSKEDWAFMFRNSALTLSTIISFVALMLTRETGGWYALVIGLLFITEMYISRSGWFEIGAPVLFTLGAFLILRDFNVDEPAYHLLVYSLVWLIGDLLAHLTFTNPRPLAWGVRGFGAFLAIINYGILFTESDPSTALIGFGIYTLLALTVSLVYRQATLFYAFTLTLPLFVTFLFREFGITKWIHPVIVIAVLYYAAGFILRTIKQLTGWDMSLLYSGLGLGVIVSLSAPVLGGVDAAIPVAVAATLWAVEAFAKKNAWLAFPANGLYLLAYFIILFELKVDEPQFFSMGAALLGLIQHYLLVRAESKSGAFIMGMVSQFVLLGTTYIEMVNKNELSYFFVLFFQSLVVLVYGLVVRSRSLTFFPIGFVVLGVMTVIYSALKGIATIFLIGCTGLILLALGILAVVMRERVTKLSEKLSDWKA